MRAWKRWQNWVAAAAGAYAALCSLWTPVNDGAAGSLMIAGILILVSAIFALATPVVLLMDWAQAVLGAALFISPWVLMFAHLTAAALTAWIAGLVTAVVGTWSALAVQQMRREELKHHRPNYDVR